MHGKKFFEVGQQLFQSGDKARGIPACMACHGPDGAGNPGPAYPHLAGQQAAYTQRRLEEYRAGTTTQKDPHLFNVMATVAKQLTDEEIGSLSSYLQGLHARADDFAAEASPAPAAHRPRLRPLPPHRQPPRPPPRLRPRNRRRRPAPEQAELLPLTPVRATAPDDSLRRPWFPRPAF